jgi:hypothetical protein
VLLFVTDGRTTVKPGIVFKVVSIHTMSGCLIDVSMRHELAPVRRRLPEWDQESLTRNIASGELSVGGNLCFARRPVLTYHGEAAVARRHSDDFGLQTVVSIPKLTFLKPLSFKTHLRYVHACTFELTRTQQCLPL